MLDLLKWEHSSNLPPGRQEAKCDLDGGHVTKSCSPRWQPVGLYNLEDSYPLHRWKLGVLLSCLRGRSPFTFATLCSQPWLLVAELLIRRDPELHQRIDAQWLA